VAACLDSFRAIVFDPGIDDATLVRLRRSSRGDELNDAAILLRRAIAMCDDAVDAGGCGTKGMRSRRLERIRSELRGLLVEIQQRMLDAQQEMVRGIKSGLDRLSAAETTDRLVALAASEVCRSCGVDRCCIFRTDGARLYVTSVHFSGDDAFQEEWEAYARANPAELKYQDREVEALRRRVPVLVDDVGHRDGMRDLISAGRASSYVASPIVVRDSVVGMMHADRYHAGQRVDPVLRDALGAFAAGFGYALERNALIEGTRSQLTRIRALIGEVEGSLDSLLHPDRSLMQTDASQIFSGPLHPVGLPIESRIAEVLTRRELEVVELMGRGASNADIALKLVISEGTVKSHVKHILRKLRAANRAQAVAAYMRIKALSGFDER
jgi:LuxR family transcriptional regulator, regulator of acetate metabolism